MTEKYLVTSTSELKLAAVRRFVTLDGTVTGFNCDKCNLPPQPIHGLINDKYSNTHRFAKERIRYAQKECPEFDQYDYVISIENGIDTHNGRVLDRCFVVIYHKTNFARGVSGMTGCQVPMKEWVELVTLNELQTYPGQKHVFGFNVTVGEILHDKHPEINPKNWILQVNKCDRKDQIFEGIQSAFENLYALNQNRLEVNSAFVAYQDFPKPGVLFLDLFPMIRNPDLCDTLMGLFQDRYADTLEDIDVVVGLESRGFILGAFVARDLGLSFVPVRKAGKLPGDLYSKNYGTEYSNDTCQIQKDSITAGQRVLIVDDLIATGGSMRAAVELVELCGGVVVDCCVLKNVPELKSVCDEHLKCNYTVLLAQ